MAATRLLIPVGAAVFALSACGAPGGSTPERVTVPTATSDLVGEGAWWADGVLHLGDREHRVEDLRTFAVARRTVVYTEGDGRLCFSDLTEQSCSTFEPYGDPVVSPDGDHVGFLDAAHGERDRFDTRQLVVTVLDLEGGDVVVASTEDMGDPGEDDLADLYEDGQPLFRGFTASDEPVVDGAGTPESTVDWEPRDVPGRAVRLERRGAEVRVVPGAIDNSIDSGRLSPDGTRLVTGTEEYDSDLRVTTAPEGRLDELSGPEDPWWAFGVWSGPHEFLATTTDEAQTRLGLQRCDAGTATCELVQDFPEGIGSVVFPLTVGTDTQDLSGF